MKNKCFFVLLLALLALTGCSNKVALSGKVVYSDDGSPLTTGTVSLETDTFFARGNLKEDGTFIVGSLKEKDGLPPGRYRVAVSGATKVLGYFESTPMLEPLIDPKYSDSRTSGLTIDIQQSTRDFVIEVDRYVTPARGRR